MITNSKIQFFCLLFFLLILTSCATKKPLDTKAKDIDSFKKVIENHNKVLSINNKYSLNSTLTLSKDDKKYTVGSTFDFFSGNQMDVSFSYFGFNVANGSFNQNEFAFYEKVKKSFVRSNYNLWNKDLFNAQSIEKLILGRFFLDLNLIMPIDFKQEDNAYQFTFDFVSPVSLKLQSKENPQITIKTGVAKFDSDYRLTEVALFSDLAKPVVAFFYNEWKIQNDLIFPSTIQIQSETDKSTIVLKHRSANTNNKTRKDFVIPSGYKEIDLENLLNLVE